MTKAEFIKAIHAELGEEVKAAAAARALDAVAKCALDALLAGDEVPLPGIGKLSVVDRAARKGRNPRTGATVNVPAKKAVKFTPFKNLQEALQ